MLHLYTLNLMYINYMKFKKTDILDDQIIKNFFNNRNISDNTKEQYEIRIRSYCNFTEKTSTELVDEAVEEQDNGVIFSDRKVKKYLQDFIDKLIEKGKSENTIKAHLETIKALYYDNGIDPPNMKTILKKDVKNPVLEELPTKEHIRKALKYCNLRDKAIIILQFSSGMNAADVRHLTYGKFYDAINEYINLHGNMIFNIDKLNHQLKNKDNIIGIWNIIHSNTDIEYLTYNSSESNKAIIDYLIERNNKKPFTSFDEPLFIANGNMIEEHTFSHIYRRINQRACFGYRNEKRNFLTSHIPRKMFQRALLNSGVEYLAVELMLGHKIDNIKSAYYKNNPTSLKEEYLKGLKNITLEEVKVEIVTTERYDNIIRDLTEEKEKRKKLENRIEKLEEQNSENMKHSNLKGVNKDTFEKEGQQAFRNI